MVLPQLDAYHSGRQMQHLQPWESVALAQHCAQHSTGKELCLTYNFAAYAGFHAVSKQICCRFSRFARFRNMSRWERFGLVEREVSAS
jgi:hypothetical protein